MPVDVRGSRRSRQPLDPGGEGFVVPRVRTSGTRRRWNGSASAQIMVSDGPHGLRAQLKESDHVGLATSEPATCYPTASALGSSWNRELFASVGEALGREASALGVSVVLGPGINIKRSPLCGRNFEYVSEDPYLSGALAVAMVHGDPEPRGRHVGQALRRQQPGGRPAPGQRRGRRAHAAGDLPAGLRGSGQAGSALDGDVCLQQGQRHVRLRASLVADRGPARRVGLRRRRGVGLGSGAQPRRGAGRGPGPGDAAESRGERPGDRRRGHAPASSTRPCSTRPYDGC